MYIAKNHIDLYHLLFDKRNWLYNILFKSLICINISDLLESESQIIDNLRKYMVDCDNIRE